MAATLALTLAACAVPVDENTADGETIVSLPTGSWRSMTVADGAAILVDRGEDAPERMVLAWDLEASRVRWRTAVPWGDGPFNAGGAIYEAEGALVLVLRAGVTALDTASGAVRWNALDDAHVEGLGVANGAFYGVVEGERFVALDLRDGHELASVPSPERGKGYFGCEAMSAGGRAATLTTSVDEGASTFHRVALWPALGRPEPVRGPPLHLTLTGPKIFGPGVTRADGGIRLALAGDEQAPTLEGWSTDDWARRWEIALPASPEVIPFDHGRWFVLEDGALTELRRAEDGSVACAFSFAPEEAPTRITSLDDRVVLHRPGVIEIYDPRDCSLRWSGRAPDDDDHLVDFDARRLVILERVASARLRVVDLVYLDR